MSFQSENEALAAKCSDSAPQLRQEEAVLGSLVRPGVLVEHPILGSPEVLKVCAFIARQQADDFRATASLIESRRHTVFGRLLNLLDGGEVDLLKTARCSYSKILVESETFVPGMSSGAVEEALRALFKTGLVEPISVADVSPIGTGWASIEGVRITSRALFDAVS